MSHISSKSLTGLVTIMIRGKAPEQFLETCVQNDIEIWNVQKVSPSECRAVVKLTSISTIRKLVRNTNYKIRFLHKKGLPFFIGKLCKRKEIIVSVLIAFMMIIFLSNILWKIEIKGLSQEVEKKMIKQLNTYGIHKGSWTFTLSSSKKIQQQLMDDIPELLWVGVEKKGTSLHFNGVEKEIAKKKKVNGPSHLVATKKGVIQKMYVSKGVPLKKVNQYVKPGDILVSGEVTKEIQKGQDVKDKKTQKEKQVSAEGEVIAKTWYETKVNIPFKMQYEVLTGHYENKYAIQIGDFKIPFWGIGKSDYHQMQIETEKNDIYFLKWKLPLQFVDTKILEKEFTQKKRSKNEAIQYGKKQARQELQLQIGAKANITQEKILHERIENGKVTLTLYYTVEEDIATSKAIQ